MIIAHRGASFDAPENTLASVQMAWEQGADAVEIDVRMTRDGRIVLMHDKDAARTGGVKKLVADMTFSEIRGLDVGGWKGERWAGERAPELQEVLAVVPGGRVLFVEIKCGAEIVAPLIEALSKAGFSGDRAAIMSFHPRVLKKVVRTLKEMPVYLLADVAPAAPPSYWEPTLDEMVHMARDIGAKGLSVRDRPVVDNTFAARLRGEGLRCFVWTVDDPERAKQLLEAGADGIVTNRPGAIRPALDAAF